jgi:hypothetical protein
MTKQKKIQIALGAGAVFVLTVMAWYGLGGNL